MNIKLLQYRIKLILPSEGKTWVAIHQKIDSIIGDDKLTSEDRVNNLEAYLINCITWNEDRNHIATLQTCIKLILLHRGYFTDSIGILEHKLFELAFSKVPRNISEKHEGNTWIAVLTQPFIIKVLHAITPCINTPSPLPDRLSAVMKEVLTLLDDHHDRLEHQYLKNCLNKVHEHKILSSTLEHSIWSSAALESLRYLEEIIETLDSFNGRTIQSGAQMAINNRTNTQLRRAKYFVEQCQQLGEPAGDYAHTHLSNMEITLRKSKNAFSLRHRKSIIAEFETCSKTIDTKKNDAISQLQDITSQNISCLVGARNFIVKYFDDPQAIQAARNFSQKLIENNNSIGIFINTIIDLLEAQPKKSDCKKGLFKLQNIVAPKQWRHLIGELWLCLTKGLKKYRSDKSPHIDEYIKLIFKQITAKYGEKIHLLARLEAAKFLNNDGQAAYLENELQTYEQKHPDETLDDIQIKPTYAKQNQYDYIHYLLQTEINAAADIARSPMLKIKSPLRRRSRKETGTKLNSGQICQLLTPLKQDDYPYGLEVFINCLLEDADSVENESARKVVSASYGNKYINPLLLCEKKLEKQIFNRRLLIWTNIYINAQYNNTMAQQIGAWRTNELNDTDINYKLYNFARSMLCSGINQDEILVPGGCELLMDLDKKLYEITTELMVNIKREEIENLFHFAQNHPGLLEACFAQLAEREHNYTLSALLAKSSIGVALEAISSPGISSAAEPPSPVTRRKRSGSISKRRSSRSSKSEINSTVFQLALKKLTSPSHLGYMILASSLWHAELENKRDRDEKVVLSFKENLAAAKSPKNKNQSENEYIHAVILFHYFNSQYDGIWLTEEEKASLEQEFETAKNSDKMDLIHGYQEKKQYFIIQKIKTHLEHALERDLYPPASWMYAKDIYYHESFYLDGDDEALSDFIYKTIGYLEQSVTQHGYLPSLYLYAIIVKNNINLFREDGSLADKLELVKTYLELSERYVYILPSQKIEFEELVQIHKQLEEFYKALNSCENSTIRNTVLRHIEDNKDLARIARTNKNFRDSVNAILAERMQHYPHEMPCVFPEQFSNLRLPIKFSVNSVQFKLLHALHQDSKNFAALKIIGAHEQVTDLKYFFDQSTKLYSFTEKVSLFSKNPVSLNSNCLEISHSDIAILGLMKICDDFLKIDDSKVQEATNIDPILELLKLASTFEDSLWRSKITHTRLLSFANMLAIGWSNKRKGSLKKPKRGSNLVLTDAPPNSPTLKPRRETSPRLMTVSSVPSPRSSSRASSPTFGRKRHSTKSSGSARSLRRLANESSLSCSPTTPLPELSRSSGSGTIPMLKRRSYSARSSLGSPTKPEIVDIADDAHKLDKAELEQKITELLSPRTPDNTKN